MRVSRSQGGPATQAASDNADLRRPGRRGESLAPRRPHVRGPPVGVVVPSCRSSGLHGGRHGGSRAASGCSPGCSPSRRGGGAASPSIHSGAPPHGHVRVVACPLVSRLASTSGASSIVRREPAASRSSRHRLADQRPGRKARSGRGRRAVIRGEGSARAPLDRCRRPQPAYICRLDDVHGAAFLAPSQTRSSNGWRCSPTASAWVVLQLRGRYTFRATYTYRSMISA